MAIRKPSLRQAVDIEKARLLCVEIRASDFYTLLISTAGLFVLVCHFLLDSPLVHLRQPGPCVECSNSFPIYLEWQDEHIVCEEHGAKDASDDGSVAIL